MQVAPIDHRTHQPRCRGGILLEVVIALGIMTTTMAFMGAQLSNGLKMIVDAQEKQVGMSLAERMLGLLALDPALQQSVRDEEQRDGDFGEQYPGYFWALTIEPLQNEESVIEFDESELAEGEEPPTVAVVTLEILYDGAAQVGDALTETARPIHTVRFLRSTPPRVDLGRDFGLTETQVDQLTGQLTELGIDFDPTDFDPQELVALLSEDPTQFLDLATVLLPLFQQFGGGAGPDGQPALSPEDIANLFNPGGLGGGGAGLDDGGGFGGSGDPMQDLLDLRDQLNAGQPGGGLGGGRSGGTRGGGTRTDRQPGGQRGGGQAGGNPGGNPGGNSGGGSSGGATIQDLIELRDRLEREGG